jgi:hypothetical protein
VEQEWDVKILIFLREDFTDRSGTPEFFHFIIYPVGIENDFGLDDPFLTKWDLQYEPSLNAKLRLVYIEVQFRGATSSGDIFGARRDIQVDQPGADAQADLSR